MPIATINQIIPIRNNVIYWTTILTKGNTTIHTPCALPGSGLVIEAVDEFAIMVQSRLNRLTRLA
jgi:hypothetical protein